MAIPIPNRPSGYLLGDPAAAITLDAFIDIQCPHSRQAWPTLLAVMEHYQDKPVSLRVHLITLSNHRQAWDVSLGLFALADGDARKFYDFATYVYERQEQFYNAPFLHKTHDDLRQFVADLAQAHSDVNRDAFLKKWSLTIFTSMPEPPYDMQLLNPSGRHPPSLLIMAIRCLLTTALH